MKPALLLAFALASALAAPETRFSCSECVEEMRGLGHLVKMGAVTIHEYIIYLEQNFCLDDWEDCKHLVVEHFANMHTMAMEKFFIPTEICMSEPVCGADPPTKPPFF